LVDNTTESEICLNGKMPDSRVKDILPEFQKFILEKQLAHWKYEPF